MKLVLTHQPATRRRSPYRLLDEQDQEIAWANDFLDAQHLRQLSPRSLRAYAYDLLHFARWFQSQPQPLSEITESTLLDYVRHQLSQQPQTYSANRESSLDRDSLFVSIPSRTGDPQPAIPISSAPMRLAARSATAAPIAMWPSVSASSNLGALSSLCRPSRSPAFGQAFAPSAISPWWASCCSTACVRARSCRSNSRI